MRPAICPPTLSSTQSPAHPPIPSINPCGAPLVSKHPFPPGGVPRRGVSSFRVCASGRAFAGVCARSRAVHGVASCRHLSTAMREKHGRNGARRPARE
eukprot:3468531-Lingulodinium_polyedra.AAC.1